MDNFIKQYPKATFYIFSLLLAVVGWLAVHTVNNNTSALNKIDSTLNKISNDLHNTKLDVRENRTRIIVLEGHHKE